MKKLIAVCFQLLFRFLSQMFPSQLWWLRSDRLELESWRFKTAAWMFSNSLTSFISPGPPVQKAEPSNATARALTLRLPTTAMSLGRKPWAQPILLLPCQKMRAVRWGRGAQRERAPQSIKFITPIFTKGVRRFQTTRPPRQHHPCFTASTHGRWQRRENHLTPG